MIKGCVLGAPPELLGSDSDREINVLQAAIQIFSSVIEHSWFIMPADSFVKLPLGELFGIRRKLQRPLLFASPFIWGFIVVFCGWVLWIWLFFNVRCTFFFSPFFLQEIVLKGSFSLGILRGAQLLLTSCIAQYSSLSLYVKTG